MNTIIALATNVEKSSISLIRVSGETAFQATEKLVNKKIEEKDRFLTKVFIKKKFIDEVLVNVFKKPNSFTGENVIEIMCHANKHIIDEIINFYLNQGCKNAKPGEFLEQAYLNNKVTFLQAQNINEIILAKNQAVLDVYRLGYQEKTVYRSLQEIRDEVAELAMTSDMEIEYPEYEKENNSRRTQTKIKSILKKINLERTQLNRISKLEDGYKVILIGETNSGKSSLFNKILHKNRAIVTKHPGTTTDYIQEKVVLKSGREFYLIDTAGFNNTNNEIEVLGIKKTNELIKSADLIINFSNKKLSNDVNEILIKSKSDKITKRIKDTLYVSSKTSEGIDKLLLMIDNEIKKLENKVLKGSVVFKSGEKLLLELENCFMVILDELEDSKTIDLFRSNLAEAIEIINTLLGESKTYSYYDEIFRKFCIGK